MKDRIGNQQRNEHRHLAWLRANRATLIVVGLCWLGMIGWELVQHRTPVFLIAMVPVFALVRLAFFHRYKKGEEGGHS